MRYIVSIILFLLSLVTVAQVEPVPAVSNNRNWVSSISYDFSGATISKGVSFYNDLGKATQQQSWDVLTNRVWASEVRYDAFDRPALQSLSAPINNTSSFGYYPTFMRSSGSPIGLSQYDSASTLSNPPTISADVNSLGWYYSTSNTLDRYQDVTQYPYSRTVYSELNPGEVKAVLGGNKINGQWLQGYSFTIAMHKNQSSSDDKVQLADKKVIKTISRGVDGVESVAFSDTDGKTLAVARSGNEASTLIPVAVYSEILDKGYVDIHIPVGCGGNVTISYLSTTNHSLRIFNLITEELLTTSTTPSYTTNATSVSLPPGFYRFEDTKNYYGITNSATNIVAPLRINYTVNYYDYSFNEYDTWDRLTKTTQPLSPDLQTTFQYNPIGQLIATTSPDEGTAEFKYRNDGQIRFSQNSEQAKVNAFSYTNYDHLARPVESGVYTGSEIVFNNPSNPSSSVDAIIDQLDGLPVVGKTEQTFSVYDIPDATLQTKLASCRLPSQEYLQTFISSNVSYTYTQNPFTTKTWYSYDVYGRVKWIIQEIPGLGCLKTIDYTYNPVDGQLVKVDYQKHDSTERFIHQYQYNIAGQLVDVHTSTNNLTFTRQAHYIYNESGALVRTELADNLQGIDYVYNLNGQLKAINHPSIIADLDPGSDGTTGSTFAADVFGMAIDYYNGDYTRVGTPKPITTTSAGTDQYNGNIKATRWNTQTPSANHSAYTYQYNKNNWLTQATFGSANTTASITSNSLNDYKVSNITYDANGNIQTLNRKGYTDAAGTNSMDNFTYRYSSTLGNRLLSIKDTEDNTDANRYNDLKDQDVTVPTGSTGFGGSTPTTTLDNYIYNDLGQLTMNIQDKVIYDYNASGLVTKISTFANSSEASEYKTVYFNDYSNFTLTNHGWANVGGPNARVFSFGFGLLPCPILEDLPLYESQTLQINGDKTVRKQFLVTPNTTFRLNFDLILDKLLSNESELEPETGIIVPVINIPIQPSIVVKLKRPDGTIFHTQTIASQPAEYCSRYFDTHITHEFTTTSDQETFSLELEILNDYIPPTSPFLPTTSSVSNYQKTYLDNLHLEAATNAKVAFYYNDKGQRVRKESYLSGGNTNTTFYVRDASGSVMGIYSGSSGPTIRTGPPSLKENTIFGSGRIGIFKRGDSRTASYALYELTDHLGNIRAVIQKTSAGLLALTNKTDYYPFGSPMPNKTTTDGNYRYAFQGQEKDPETGMEAFELRLWDGRIGRWLTVDPKHEFDSPYLGMGNDPVNLSDPDGGSTSPPNEYDWDVSAGTYKLVSNKGGDKTDYINVIVGGEKQWTIIEPVKHVSVLINVTSSTFTNHIERTPGEKRFVAYRFMEAGLYDPSAEIFLTFVGEKVAGEVVGKIYKGGVNFFGRKVAQETTEQSIKNLRRKAVRQAWKLEKELVKETGRGTRDWTEKEVKQLLMKGKVKDYIGHHINNVKHYPKLAGNPANIEFVTKTEHLLKHGGNWKNKTSGALINR